MQNQSSPTIRPEFTIYVPTEANLEAENSIAAAFSSCLTTIETLVPASRERSLVVTKLQEAAFWARRANAAPPK